MNRDLADLLMEKAIPVPESGCWLWTGATNQWGYGNWKSGGKTLKAHRASYEIHVGAIPAGAMVCHRCDVPGCINPDHLFLGSHADNMADMERKGRSVPPRRHGEHNSHARLSSADALSIYRDARGDTETAADYGVRRNAVTKIRNGKAWQRITGHPAHLIGIRRIVPEGGGDGR